MAHFNSAKKNRITNLFILMFGLIVAYVFINVRWIWLYRHAQPLDIDESGYLIIALLDHRELIAGGVTEWVHSVLAPGIQAPLTTALASLLFAITGPHVVAGFAVPVVAGVLTIAASYSLARRLLPPMVAFTAAALVAFCPVILNYARSFHFALPATAVMTIALLCIVRSDRFSKIGWAVLFGISLGLMPLARTMTIAFVPGLVVGAIIYAVMGQGDRMRRISILAGALVVALATAASWLWFNGVYVFAYLFNFGYGSKAAEYGAKASLFGWTAWTDTARDLLGYIYLPHALVVVAGGVALCVLLWRTTRRYGVVGVFNRAVASPLLPIVACIGEVLVALTSSQNKGTAFIAPIVPAILILSVVLIHRARGGRPYPRLAGLFAAMALVVVALPMLDLAWRPARPWMVTLPWVSEVMMTDGRGPIHQYEDYGGVQPQAGPGQSRDRAGLKAWLTVNQTTAAVLRSVIHEPTSVAVGFRGFLYNTSSMRLQVVLTGADIINLIQIDPVETDGAKGGYQEWLGKGAASAACFLMTLRDDKEDILPSVLKREMEEAGRQAGFVPVKDWPVPDGNVATLWSRAVSRPSCAAR